MFKIELIFSKNLFFASERGPKLILPSESGFQAYSEAEFFVLLKAAPLQKGLMSLNTTYYITFSHP